MLKEDVGNAGARNLILASSGNRDSKSKPYLQSEAVSVAYRKKKTKREGGT